MTDDSDSVVAREQSLRGFETVFPIEVISEIAPLCVGVGIGCRGGSLHWNRSVIVPRCIE